MAAAAHSVLEETAPQAAGPTPASLLPEEEDLEASAASPPTPARRGRAAVAAAFAAIAVTLGTVALVGQGSLARVDGFSSDADLVSLALQKAARPAAPRRLDQVDDAIERAENISAESDRTLAEGMRELGEAVQEQAKTGSNEPIVKALRSLRMAVATLMGEVKSLETGLNMCGNGRTFLICAGNFSCCFGLCCRADAVCCPGIAEGTGLCGMPGSVCKAGVVLAPPLPAPKPAPAPAPEQEAAE